MSFLQSGRLIKLSAPLLCIDIIFSSIVQTELIYSHKGDEK